MTYELCGPICVRTSAGRAQTRNSNPVPEHYAEIPDARVFLVCDFLCVVFVLIAHTQCWGVGGALTIPVHICIARDRVRRRSSLLAPADECRAHECRVPSLLAWRGQRMECALTCSDITAKLYGYMLVKQFYWVLTRVCVCVCALGPPKRHTLHHHHHQCRSHVHTTTSTSTSNTSTAPNYMQINNNFNNRREEHNVVHVCEVCVRLRANARRRCL